MAAKHGDKIEATQVHPTPVSAPFGVSAVTNTS